MIESSASQQVLVFFIICVVGFFTGIIFDFFRAIKIVFQLRSIILFLIDLIVSLVISFLVFQLLFQLHWGEIRVYIFVSFFSGIILYYLFISRCLYRAFYRFFRKCLKMILKIYSIGKDLQSKSRIKINRIVKYWGSVFRKEK